MPLRGCGAQQGAGCLVHPKQLKLPRSYYASTSAQQPYMQPTCAWMSTAFLIARGLMKWARHQEARSCPFLQQAVGGEESSSKRPTGVGAHPAPLASAQPSLSPSSLANVVVGAEHGQQCEVVALPAAEPGVRLCCFLALAAAGTRGGGMG